MRIRKGGFGGSENKCFIKESNKLIILMTLLIFLVLVILCVASLETFI